jgi:type I restriction enzyme S subunit
MRPYLRVANVFEDRIDTSDVMEMELDARAFDAYRLEHGDILLNEGQSAELVGRPAMFRGEIADCCFTNTLVRFRCGPAAMPDYALLLFRYWLHNGTFQSIAKITTNIAHLGAGRFAELSMPIAPLAEQARIIAAVNALFEEVEAGEAALARARESLAEFRASLLHAACTGALTADWRAANPTNDTGHDLLAVLLGQRRTRWEADFRANAARVGKRLRDDAWKARYPTPRDPDLTDIPALPESWTWVSLDQLSHDSSYGTSVKCDVSADGLAVLRIPNVQAGAVTWSNLKFATADLGLETAYLLAPGDLLIVRTNGSPDLVGRAALVAGWPERPSYFASYLIRFRLVGSPAVQRWVASVFRSGLVRPQVARFAATSAGQYNVSQTNLAGFAIPLPPESEGMSRVMLRKRERRCLP